MNVFVTALGYW